MTKEKAQAIINSIWAATRRENRCLTRNESLRIKNLSEIANPQPSDLQTIN